MRHPFMERLANSLGERGIATFRYDFPYMTRGDKRTDPPAVSEATVRAAVALVAEQVPELPILAGGKSYGGRMTARAAADGGLPGARGLVFFGFPLHRPNSRSLERAEHLYRVPVPMLFLQGTRDHLADLELLRPVVMKIGERATLHVVEGADHGFSVLKRSGRTPDEVMRELADAVRNWAETKLGWSGPRRAG